MEEEENKSEFTSIGLDIERARIKAFVQDKQDQKNGVEFFHTTNFFSTSNKPIRIVLDGWMDLVLARIERGEK